MKFIILFLLLLAPTIAVPTELQFLEKLLPNSQHIHTSVAPSTPSGIIFSEYVGPDDLSIIKASFQKSLGIEVQEIPIIKKETTFLSAWAAALGVDQRKHTFHRLQGADISIDVLIYYINDDAAGTSSRHIAIQIIRKSP